MQVSKVDTYKVGRYNRDRGIRCWVVGGGYGSRLRIGEKVRQLCCASARKFAINLFTSCHLACIMGWIDGLIVVVAGAGERSCIY